MSGSGRWLGALLAGGQSRRFGSPKALATLRGRTIAARALDALREVTPHVVAIVNDPKLLPGLQVPTRADLSSHAGPLAGIEAALNWALEENRPGVLCVACDMPFLQPPLLRALLAHAQENHAPIVAPEDENGNVQPLCAVYRVDVLPEITARIARGSLRALDLLDALPTERIRSGEVRRLGDPRTLFLNVNTPADHAAALRIARQEEDSNAQL